MGRSRGKGLPVACPYDSCHRLRIDLYNGYITVILVYYDPSGGGPGRVKRRRFAMIDAVKRTQTWREQKREKGYQPVTIWIPAKVKQQMVTDAFARHQDLGALIVEVYLAHPPTRAGRGAVLMDQRQVQALVKEQIAQALASQSAVFGEGTPTETAPPARAAAAPALPPPLRPPAAPGMKWCKKGLHQFPMGKGECPPCATIRKRAHRTKKAKARQGEIPA